MNAEKNRKTTVTSYQISVAAFGIALNVVGAYLALVCRLPVYLDSIGSILTAALLGPVWGAAAAFGGCLISGITSDIYALYFMPATVMTAMMSGIVFRFRWLSGWKLPLGVFAFTAPGTLISSFISAYLFGGVTSSGSSLFVMVFHRLGMNLVASAYMVQFVTEYLDRFLAVVAVTAFLSVYGKRMKRMAM